MGAGEALVGRGREQDRVAALLRDATAGRPGALLVAGEPGIGKTSLVTAATSGPAAEGHSVLWGRCLRFGAESSPYLPFTQLLTHWHRRSDQAERSRVLAGERRLSTIVPALAADGDPAGPAGTTGPAGSPEQARLVPLIASVLDRIAAERPLTVVVDDVQWADGSSLDLLAYLLAGFTPGQRLAVLATYRDTELVDGHPLLGWLADVVRLPGVSRLPLARLGPSDVEDLVARLRDDGPTTALAAEVFRRSDGNPYYAELLARSPRRTHDDSADGEDPDLRQALLHSWQRLSPRARELLQLLAVGGRPVLPEVLQTLVESRGGQPDRVPTWLAEAAAAGLVTPGPHGTVWFHHPLIPEVVAAALAPGARREVHRGYVEVLQRADDLTPASRTALLALHHHGAGDADAAFRWSLAAADAAAMVHGHAEVSEHLHRACQVWDDVSDDVRAGAGHPAELWRRASEAAWSAGEPLLAVRLREQAVERLGAGEDPALELRLRLPLLQWRPVCGLAPPIRREAALPLAELAARTCPETPEHAEALARLAFGEVWSARSEEARAHADAAIGMARRLGSDEALARALAIGSQCASESSVAIRLARRGLALAREGANLELRGTAAIATANCHDRLGQPAEAADTLLTTFGELLELGSVHDAMWASPEYAAVLLIGLGRWDEVTGILRELLSRRLPPMHGAETRGAAALLAYRTGDGVAGGEHMARARELLPGPWGPGQPLCLLSMEEDWARGRYREVLDAVEEVLAEQAGLDPGGADELMELAARAAGDLADSPGHRDEAAARLEALDDLRGPRAFVPASPHDRFHPALGRFHHAERTRVRDDPAAAERWREAVSACRDAGLVWHRSLASYQLARCLLRRPGARSEAAAALREAAGLAGRLGASPVLRDAERLAARWPALPPPVPRHLGPTGCPG